MKLRAVDLARIIRESLVSWFKDDAPSMGAALAFYTLFAIAPILLVFIWIAGMIVRPDVVQRHILAQLTALLGDSGAAAVRNLLLSSKYGARSAYSTAFGVAAVFIGATSVFAELQNSLNRIWRVPPAGVVQGIWQAVRARILSFGLVFGVGFLLLVSLIASAGLEAIGGWLGEYLADWHDLLIGVDAGLGFLLATILFAMIYKYVPRQSIAWRDVWVGAAVTASLFTVGKWVIVVYLGRIAFASAYGIAGSFLVFLLWVYYSAQIFLLGAEFTRNFATARNARPPGPAAAPRRG
jgi:membrane protein